jgi:hypothetical protein
MVKQFKVEGFSRMMDAEMNCATIEQASDIFGMMMESDLYTHGYIADNETGEVYCYFNKEVDGNGIKTEYWTAFA